MNQRLEVFFVWSLSRNANLQGRPCQWVEKYLPLFRTRAGAVVGAGAVVVGSGGWKCARLSHDLLMWFRMDN